jgi:hypothetical protein
MGTNKGGWLASWLVVCTLATISFIYLFILTKGTQISRKEINTDKLITGVKVDKGSRQESTIAHEVI